MRFEDFLDDYYSKGQVSLFILKTRKVNNVWTSFRIRIFLKHQIFKLQVKEIVYQPQFEIANVYLYKSPTNEPKNWLAQRVRIFH